MRYKSLLTVLFLVCCFNLNSQNLLDTSTWAQGTGSVIGFNAMGSDSENVRELGNNHISEEYILWKSVPDANFDEDGGWNTDYVPIDNSLTYRFSVWIKKTNSHEGITYFGCYGNFNTILKLDNSFASKPTFFAGNLPILDRWYLLVGYVHKSSSLSYMANIGRIYDGVTGKAVGSLIDYKFSNTADIVLHTAYLKADTNIEDRQYYLNPRLEPINGNEPSIQELLKININSTFRVQYDTAGNQKDRIYCETGFCLSPKSSEEDKDIILSEDRIDIIEKIETFEKSVKLYPNPTIAKVSILVVSNSNIDFSKKITIYSATGALVESFFIEADIVFEVDLSDKASGIYFVHAQLTDGQHINKKIIKE